MIVDTVVTIALLVITGGEYSPLFYYALFPILTAALRFNPIVDLITTAIICLLFFGMGAKWPDLLVPVGMALIAGVLLARRGLGVEATRALPRSW